jgi:hypothetical protein
VDRPILVGKHSGFYLSSPTSIRNYLDYPEESVLKSMPLPYPFRVKQPVSQRMDRLGSSSSFDMLSNTSQQVEKNKRSNSVSRKSSSKGSQQSQQRIRPLRRHSLALGQVDPIINGNSAVVTNTLLKPAPNNQLSVKDAYPGRTSRESVAQAILSEQTAQNTMTDA